MADRGVAGAEVVDRNAHAERAQFVEVDGSADEVVDDDGFGDLEDQSSRVEATGPECVADVADERCAEEVAGRDVDRHIGADELTVEGPCCELIGCFDERPAAEFVDQV